MSLPAAPASRRKHGRVGRVADRQLGRLEDLVAVEVGDRDLGRRHEVQVVAGDDVHLVFLVRDLAGAAGRRGVDHGRRPDLGEAVLAGVDVEEPVDQGALEARARAACRPGSPEPVIFAPRSRSKMPRAAPSSQCGRRVPGRAAGRCVGADLADQRLVARQLLAPGPDRDVGLLAADRDVGVGRVRDPQQQVVELGLDRRPARRRSPRSGSPASVDGAPEGRDLRAVRRPRRRGSPRRSPCEAALRSALRRSPSAEQRAARRVDGQGRIDDRRILALVDRALRGSRPAPRAALQPDAHRRALPTRSPARPAGGPSQPLDDERRLEAGQQPAGARAVGAAEERQVEGAERAARRQARPSPARREDQRLPGVARAGRVARSAAVGEGREDRPAGRSSSAGRLVRQASCWTAIRARSGAYVSSQASRGGDPLARGSPPRARVSGAPFSAAIRAADVDARDLERAGRDGAKAGRKPRPPPATSASGRAASSGRRARGPAGSSPLTSRPAVASAIRSNSSNSRGMASVPSGSNSIAWLRPRPQEEEAELLRRHDLGDRVGRGARGPSTSTSSAADVQELVRHVERRLALEDLAGDRVGPVARPAGRGEVLAAGLDRDPEEAPLGGPLEVPAQLGPARRTARPSRSWPQPRAQVTRSGRHS